MQITAAVFEVGGRAAHHRDEAPEQVGNRVARPGGGYRYPDTADTVDREGTGSALMVMGVKGQHGQHLAGAQAHAEIDHPNEAVPKGGWAQGHGAFWMPRAKARRLRTRETARNPIRTTKKSWRAIQTTSTLGRATSPCMWASS